jgi:hypothetical protein
MRKGSTKHKDTFALPSGKVEVVYSTESTKLVDLRESRILDILTSLCDACHEMDTRTEPWAGIRKDIEKLR